MDVEETLRIIRGLIKQMELEDGTAYRLAYIQHARDLAEHVEALDEWLSKGGFKPKEWQ